MHYYHYHFMMRIGYEHNYEVIRLIELGCELEDVESLIPNKLNSTLDSMYNKTIELLRKSEISVNNNKKWID